MKKLLMSIIAITISLDIANCQAIQKEKMDTSIGYIDSNGVVTYYVAPESAFIRDSTGKLTNLLKCETQQYVDSVNAVKRKSIHKNKKHKPSTTTK